MHGKPNLTNKLQIFINLLKQCLLQAFNGTLIGTDCDKPEPVSNVFLMSIVLFFGTFTISIILKEFKNALIFPSKVEHFIIQIILISN